MAEDNRRWCHYCGRSVRRGSHYLRLQGGRRGSSIHVECLLSRNPDLLTNLLAAIPGDALEEMGIEVEFDDDGPKAEPEAPMEADPEAMRDALRVGDRVMLTAVSNAGLGDAKIGGVYEVTNIAKIGGFPYTVSVDGRPHVFERKVLRRVD